MGGTCLDALAYRRNSRAIDAMNMIIRIAMKTHVSIVTSGAQRPAL
jgi:hypothetical protein